MLYLALLENSEKSNIVEKTHLVCYIVRFSDFFHMRMMNILSFHSFHKILLRTYYLQGHMFKRVGGE